MEALLRTTLPAVVAVAAIALLMRAPIAATLADRPNERSLHTHARARVGGLGIAAAVALFAAIWIRGALALELACAVLLVGVCARDDVRSLPITLRLFAQAASAVAALYVLEDAFGALPFVVAIAAAFAIVWMSNLFNFMDGADGLAGGMAAVGFGAYAIAAMLAGETALAWTCAAIASACVGFLVHNFPPARVFMGDAGSVPLGFLAAVLGLHGILAGAWPVAFPLIVFAPFIVDATLTVARRAWRREPVWRAHRQHAYQRLVLAGWSHRRLACAAYGLMLAGAAAAVVAATAGPSWRCGIMAVCAGAYALLFFAIERYLIGKGRDG